MQPEIPEVQDNDPFLPQDIKRGKKDEDVQSTVKKATIVVQNAQSKIHFHFTEELVNALTWEEYEALELAQDGDMKLYRIRPLLIRFMVNEKGEPMLPSLANALLAKIPILEVPGIIQKFVDALKADTVPKEKGNSSGLPSEASPAA